MSEAILLVDQDVEELRRLGGDLEVAGFEVARELDPASALAALERLSPDVALIGAELAAGGGTSLLEALRQRGIPVIVAIDPPGNLDVVALLREGAKRILVRPLASEALVLVARQMSRGSRMAQVRRLREAEHSTGGRLDAAGTQPPMRAVAISAAELGHHDATAVLVTGERGAGKTWMARLIHETSPRAEEPFLVVNAVPGDLQELESRIFGHERDALPGAERRVLGMLELALGGTLVLREIGEWPLELQPLVLRALEQRTHRRIGGRRDLPVEARLIATTSGDLGAAAETGRFRGDLLERLSSVVLRVPPVRERSDTDRRQLVARIHDGVASRMGAAPPSISPEAMDRMLEYGWPGNVSEVEHVIERAALMAAGQPMILVEHLPGEFRARPGLGDRRHHAMSLEEVEKRQIESSLRYHGGNRTRAAKELGISRATLINKIKRYEIAG